MVSSAGAFQVLLLVRAYATIYLVSHFWLDISIWIQLRVSWRNCSSVNRLLKFACVFRIWRIDLHALGRSMVHGTGICVCSLWDHRLSLLLLLGQHSFSLSVVLSENPLLKVKSARILIHNRWCVCDFICERDPALQISDSHLAVFSVKTGLLR